MLFNTLTQLFRPKEVVSAPKQLPTRWPAFLPRQQLGLYLFDLILLYDEALPELALKLRDRNGPRLGELAHRRELLAGYYQQTRLSQDPPWLLERISNDILLWSLRDRHWLSELIEPTLWQKVDQLYVQITQICVNGQGRTISGDDEA